MSMPRVALASPRVATSLDDGLEKIERMMSEAATKEAEIVCFPEAYLPGLRGHDFDVLPWDDARLEQALKLVAGAARTHEITTILCVERSTKSGRQIAAFVFDERGNRQGVQTKNQLDPYEDEFYVPGNTRRIFQSRALTFGIAICHEGWRYPETVRWAAVRGAKIVFQPQHTGHEKQGTKLKKWGAAGSPYYEHAMQMRARENTIYFASVNCALPFQESATSLINPAGECQAFQPYGEEGILVQELDLEQATGLLARRYAPTRYQSE